MIFQGGWIPRKYANTGYEEKSKLFELQQKFNLLKSENEHLKSQNEKASQKVQGFTDRLSPYSTIGGWLTVRGQLAVDQGIRESGEP